MLMALLSHTCSSEVSCVLVFVLLLLLLSGPQGATGEQGKPGVEGPPGV